MVTVAAADFCRNFGVYQREVQREAIEVKNHGRTTGYFVSPHDWERFQQFVAESQKAYHPSELPDHLKAAIGEARMDPAHDHLNDLMDD